MKASNPQQAIVDLISGWYNPAVGHLGDVRTRSARWSGRQRLGHGVGALVTAVLLLAWALRTARPDLFGDLLRALLCG